MQIIVPLAVFLNGLFAGTFIGSTLIEHAARRLESSAWVAYKRAKENVLGAVMPGFLAATLAVSWAAAFFSPHHSMFVIVGASLAAVLVITVVVHLPINRFIQSGDSIPPDWDALRRRWRVWNLVRCALAVLAHAIALGAAYGGFTT